MAELGAGVKPVPPGAALYPARLKGHRLYLKDGEEAYARLAEEFRVDAGTRQEADRRIFGIVPMELPENLDKALADWTGEYHRNTGVGA